MKVTLSRTGNVVKNRQKWSDEELAILNMIIQDPIAFIQERFFPYRSIDSIRIKFTRLVYEIEDKQNKKNQKTYPGNR